MSEDHCSDVFKCVPWSARAALVCSLGATALLLASCGGDGDSSSAGTAAAASAAGPASSASTSTTSSVTMPSVSCESLLVLQLPNTAITAAQSIPAGSYQPPGSSTTLLNLPAFCRVTATLTPVPGSSIAVELWLPMATWNGRYQQVGNHGWGSGIEWGEMAPQLQAGFVVGATDDGHAPTGGFDVSWVPGFPERLTDFAYRAVHETASSAKLIVNAYYAKAASYAYFNGCSSGGREAMTEVQKYPQDFNGVIAGSALLDWTRIATQEFVVSQQLLQSGLEGKSGAALLTVAQNAAIAACDAVDGVTDGVIRDPRSCHWDPHTIQCTTGQDPTTCLTGAQADALTVSFAPLRDPVTQQAMFAGQSQAAIGDWLRFGYNLGLFSFPVAQYRIAFNNFNWDGTTFNLHTDYPVLDQALGFVNADINPDLSAFKNAGGKIIQWHGWGDGVSMPQAIVAYYDRVRDGTTGGDRTSQQSFYRLFMLPGVGHCGSGPGPANFGAEGQTVVSNDAQHNAVLALQDWVEKGTAPDTFIATKFQNDDPTKPITMQRPLCPHPSQAVYKGSGDPNNASNFHCG